MQDLSETICWTHLHSLDSFAITHLRKQLGCFVYGKLFSPIHSERSLFIFCMDGYPIMFTQYNETLFLFVTVTNSLDYWTKTAQYHTSIGTALAEPLSAPYHLSTKPIVLTTVRQVKFNLHYNSQTCLDNKPLHWILIIYYLQFGFTHDEL